MLGPANNDGINKLGLEQLVEHLIEEGKLNKSIPITKSKIPFKM